MAIESSMAKFLVGRSRIKYIVLDQLFRTLNITQDRVVMYVDMAAILERLYRKRDIEALYGVDPSIVTKDIVLSVLNTIGHYRRYLMTRLGLTNDIVMIFNRKRPEFQSLIMPKYRDKWYDAIDPDNKEFGPLTATVSMAWSFIKSIVPYFEGLYCVDAPGVDDYTVMYHLKHSKYYGDGGWYHLIFSRNMLATQMVGPDCTLIYNKRDDSYFVSNVSLFQNGVLRGLKTGATESLGSKSLPFIWCLGGCSDIGLKRSKFASGVPGVIKKLNPLVEQGIITEDMSIQSFLKIYADHIDEGRAELKALPEELINRYRLVNLELSARALTQSQEIDIWKDHIDLFDQNALEDINERLVDIDGEGDILDIGNLSMANAEGELKTDFFGFEDFFESNFSF